MTKAKATVTIGSAKEWATKESRKAQTKREIKRYVVSSIITFLTGFLTVVSIQITDLTPETLSQATILGIMIASLRGGIKALVEYLPTIK